MSLSRFLPATLKMRLALSYALLFFLSCCIVFIMITWFISRTLEQSTDAATEEMADTIRTVYVAGRRFNQQNSLLPGDQYPEESRRRLEEADPEVEILFFSVPRFTRESQSELHNTAFVLRDGDFYEMRPQSDGTIYSRKISLGNNLEHVRRHFLLALCTCGKDNIRLAIEDDDGTELLSSDALLGEFAPEDTVTDTRNFRFRNFSLPDGKHLIIGRKIEGLVEAGGRYFIIFIVVLAAVTICGICAGWLLSRRFIGGIARITSAMRRTTTGDYACRIDEARIGSDREIIELVNTFNAMNSRTQLLLEELQMLSNNVAHDLRTPLTRISGTVENLLCDRQLPENAVDSCASVAEECARMKELINTMLDISRINANPGALQKENVDLAAELREFCEIMRPAAERKGLELREEIPDFPVMISADRMKLQRLISNLTENALKFTDSGSITIRVGRENGEVLLQVEDTGCGIPVVDQKHIFERFFRSDASRNRPGNGLGLTLVQAFVNAHQWQITCDSSPGIGTKFSIRIPSGETTPPAVDHSETN